MDDEYRSKGYQAFQTALDLEGKPFKKLQTNTEFLKCIDWLVKIKDKQPKDISKLQISYYTLAIDAYNKNNYEQACKFYLESIACLHQLPANDSIYRSLTKRYIDLTDVYYGSRDQPNAKIATENAIKAFNLIQLKSAREIAIGDPIKNIREFRNYYEKQSSTASYLRSSAFRNFEQLLVDDLIPTDDDSQLLEQFGRISVSEAKQADEEIEDMLSKMSLTMLQPQAQSFIPVSATAHNDNNCRSMAQSLLRLLQNHIKNNNMADAIQTNKQILEILKSIQIQTINDGHFIITLEQQRTLFQSKALGQSAPPSLASQAGAAAASSSVTFSQPPAQANKPDLLAMPVPPAPVFAHRFFSEAEEPMANVAMAPQDREDADMQF